MMYKVKTKLTDNAEFTNFEDAVEFAATAIQSVFNLNTAAGQKMCQHYLDILYTQAKSRPLRIDIHQYVHIIYEGTTEFQVINIFTGEIFGSYNTRKEAKEKCAEINWSTETFDSTCTIREVPKD